MILIKKYPNRRLYDTSKSQYINLETIKQLVMQHQEFKVVDSKSDEDLTKSILLQIISEQEANDSQSILTQTVLKQLIRFYGSDMQVFMRQYLEQSIATFLERQDAFHGVMKEFMESTSPMSVFNQMVEKNMQVWQQFTSGQPVNPFASSTQKSENSPSSKPESPDSEEK
ncbi:polyhydroxyalkanoate synthesis repressor PhaR [Teredinibacter turnerae]|uniref:Polyhydroxyalkanoate synthesis repressor PhaR n=1 Tax=Teredinibacter turnerae (strain ATCC 39867 / T7901) TaxID=377629 RepID=C5BMK5_TERTT|nr:polyhydroxyalkanoate synthesis repressor PhaR [Teredinibacter turnerae]ACR13888.1 polyhydroxyalkanoate synthesis repressor PhaR [Teredinibacter turnerae T7901]